MSSNESSSDVEVIDTEELMRKNRIAELPARQRESTSSDLVPTNTQALSHFQDLSEGQFGEMALASASQPILTGHIDNTVEGGEFQTAFFGPVTHHNDLTRIDNRRVTNVLHYHQHAPDSRSSGRQNEPSTSGSQKMLEGKKSDEFILMAGIKVFKSEIIYKSDSGVTIYEGEKATVDGVNKMAVKFLPHSKKAMREAKSLEAIRYHPNVVGIYDTGIHTTELGKYIFIAMERCSQETLSTYVSQSKNFDCQQAINHSTQIISGLEYIHSRGIAHRDLKPNNILFLDDGGHGQVKITDFGVSKNFLTDPQVTVNLVPGTEGFIAPELIKCEAVEDSTKCDIFSLGILLYFRLSNGKHPYGEKHWRWRASIADGVEPNPSQILLPNRHQRNAVLKSIRKMLEHDPANRPTASEILNIWKNDIGDYAEEQAPESSKGEEVPTSHRSIKMTERKHQDVRPETRLVAQTHSGARKKNVEKNIEKPASRAAPYKNTDEGTRNPSASTKTTLTKSIRSWFMRESSKLDKATVKGAEGNTSSGHQQTQRKDDPGTIPIPCILGVTWPTYQFELICWKSLEDLKSKEPTVITELHEVQGVSFSVTVHMRSLYLLTEKKTCYELDLDDATKGLVKLGSMNHDHGWWPPAAVLNGKLYVCGKRHNWGESPSKKCEVFTGQWCDICELNIARNRSSVASYKGYLYSVGGLDGENKPLRSVERYDASNKKWELIQPLNVARYHADAVVYNGKMYVLGGYDGDRNWVPSYECFDSTTQTWTLHTSAWWGNNEPRHLFVFDNKVLSVLWTDGYRTIGQVPLSDEDEEDLLKVELPERWRLYNITAVE